VPVKAWFLGEVKMTAEPSTEVKKIALGSCRKVEPIENGGALSFSLFIILLEHLWVFWLVSFKARLIATSEP